MLKREENGEKEDEEEDEGDEQQPTTHPQRIKEARLGEDRKLHLEEGITHVI